MVGKYGPLIGAIDQGTSSSRFLVSFKVVHSTLTSTLVHQNYIVLNG